jgi:hypothetical protein
MLTLAQELPVRVEAELGRRARLFTLEAMVR